MKKKIFLLAVTAVLTLTLGIFAACGGNGDDNKGAKRKNIRSPRKTEPITRFPLPKRQKRATR